MICALGLLTTSELRPYCGQLKYSISNQFFTLCHEIVIRHYQVKHVYMLAGVVVQSVTATRLVDGPRKVPIVMGGRDLLCSPKVHTGSGAHTANYLRGTRVNGRRFIWA
jgi:hypothetical protein